MPTGRPAGKGGGSAPPPPDERAGKARHMCWPPLIDSTEPVTKEASSLER